MTAQAKRRLSLLSLYGSAFAIVGLIGYIVKAQDIAYSAVIEPNVQRTICQTITDSISPCKARMELLEKKMCLNDSNVIIIKSILEVMATNDQILKAKERRSNPIGIR